MHATTTRSRTAKNAYTYSKNNRQQPLQTYFPVVSRSTRNRLIHRDFRTHEVATARPQRRAAAKKSPMERPWLLRTQNVRGLEKSVGNVSAWFDCFRDRDAISQAAITLIQETHVVDGEARDMERRYRAHWGFNENAEPMSFWTESRARTGGVAILLNPYLVATAAPALVSHWTAHFMAICCEIDGQQVMVLNIYAPSTSADRERLFRELAGISLVHDGPVLLGGDFNCTQNWRWDRTYESNAQTHYSAALEELLAAWGLADALDPLLGDDLDVDAMQEFHSRHHTYHYTVHGQHESSRLDRWYLNKTAIPWFRAISQTFLGGPTSHVADHAAVTLEISDPEHRPRHRVRPKLYPPRACTVQAVQHESITQLEDTTHDFEELDAREATATEYIDRWEQFKEALKQGIKVVARAALKKTKTSCRQRVRRLRAVARDANVGPVKRRAAAAALGTEVHRWHALRRRRLGGLHANHGRSTTKEFYQRVATKFSATAIACVDATPGAPPRAETDVANRMADAWATVFTAQANAPPPDRFSSTHAEPLPSADAAALDADFTVNEVLRSIKCCKRSKSAGPDFLPNAWYRDHAEAVAPLLTTLFNQCHRAGLCPQTFREATIVCLPKGGRTSNPMGYRPISLLNTDYKVLTKALVARVKPTLSSLINPDQGGFVPGRDIHEVVDTFGAIQALAQHHQLPTVAILLDIKKAYDSVHRPYLHACLEQRGFPARFRNLIAATHDATLARFQVNGLLSEPVPLTRGIRQGCPLAPLLFILVLDPLYRWLRQDPVINEPLPTMPGVAPPVAGFADDTAVYLQSEQQMPHLLSILEDFAAASGLAVNTAKSVAIRLWPGTGPLPTDSVFRALALESFCRYLGIQVGSNVPADAVWKLTIEQLTCRLRLAERKTHSPAQRARLATAIIVPKCLYVARHHWPSTQQITDLDARIRSFVWDGDFVGRELGKCRRWMRQALATLPTYQGGLGIPCIRSEIHTMATTTVAKWAYTLSPARDRLIRATGWLSGADTLQPLTFLSAARPKLSHGSTLWRDGAHRLRLMRHIQLSPTLQVMIRDGLDALEHQPSAWRWTQQQYERDYSIFLTSGGSEIAARRRAELGGMDPDWLPLMEITATGSSILGKDGQLLTSSSVSTLGPGSLVKELVTWQWISPSVLRFRPVSVAYPLSNRASAEFRGLCDALVANFPDILQRPAEEGSLHAYNPELDGDRLWTLRGTTLVTSEHGFEVSTRTVTSQWTLQHGPTLRVGERLVQPAFACTPYLTKLVQADRGTQPWNPARRLIKRVIRTTRWSTGTRERTTRHQAWEDDDAVITATLAKMQWSKMLRAPGLSPYDSQMWHRLRLHQLLLWHPPTVTSCQRPDCRQPYDSSTGHIVWRCDAAQRLWTQIYTFWTNSDTYEDPRTEIFGWEPPPTDRDWTAGIETVLGATIDVDDRVDHWVQALWTLLMTCAVQRLWAGQVRLLFPPQDRWADDLHSVLSAWLCKGQHMLEGLYHSSAATANQDIVIVTALLKLLRTTEGAVPRFQLQQDHFLLFFDGGSRGNPGPGGSGAVIVRMSDRAEIMWAASMAYNKKTTTNNFAEFQGLCHGLSALAHHRWQPATVIGDSNMILGLLRRRTPTKSGHLRPLYDRALALSHKIHITGWHHHYRDHNKMADKAANIAMDTRTSFQALATSGRAEFDQLAPWLASDVEQWLTARLHGKETYAAFQQGLSPADWADESTRRFQ